MSRRASTPAKRAQRPRANRMTADQPGTDTKADATASWATSPATRRAMQANRRRDTAPELAIRRLVHAAGLRYRVDARPLPTARHTADMIFTRARVAVFIDGCFWHGCADHYRPPASNSTYWAGKVTRNRERDRLANEALMAAGWTVVRIWEHEAPESAARRIEAAVRGTVAGVRWRQMITHSPGTAQASVGSVAWPRLNVASRRARRAARTGGGTYGGV